ALCRDSGALSEGRNASGEEFGDARIEAAIRRGASLPAPVLAGEVAAEMHRFLGVAASEDDVSVAVIRRRARARNGLRSGPPVGNRLRFPLVFVSARLCPQRARGANLT